jgi:hypothetical protein
MIDTFVLYEYKYDSYKTFFYQFGVPHRLLYNPPFCFKIKFQK